MRDLVSCFSESSINVTPPLSLSSASSLSVTLIVSLRLSYHPYKPQLQASTESVYPSISSSKSHGVTRTIHSFTTTTTMDQNPSTSIKLNTCSRFFRKKKGNKSVDSDLGKIEVFWDLSSAKYDSSLGPEPNQGFYVPSQIQNI